MPAPWINSVPAQFFTDAGAVAASHKLYTYAAGTTTNRATYSDSALTTANANPIVLDSSGRATIFLDPALGLYKFVLKTAADATIWTRDNIGPVRDHNAVYTVTGTAGENIASLDCVYCSDGTGGETAGRWYKTDADSEHSSNNAVAVGFALNAIASAAAGTIQVQGRVSGLSSLTAGSVYYISATDGAITATAPTNKRAVGFADSTTSVILLNAEAAPLTSGPLPAIAGGGMLGYRLVDSDTTSVSSTAGNSPNEELMALTFALTDVTVATGQFAHAIFWGRKAANANVVRVELKMRLDSNASYYQVVAPATNATSGAEWVCEGLIMRTEPTAGRGWGMLYMGAPNSAMALSFAQAEEVLTNGTLWSTAGSAILQVDAVTADGDVTVDGGVLFYGGPSV